MKPKVAVISTGGTIGSLGHGQLDFVDYAESGRTMDAAALLERLPTAPKCCEAVPVSLFNVPSTKVDYSRWKQLLDACEEAVKKINGLKGIVVLHGTSTLEETAYFLHLTLRIKIPVVLTGSLRPSNSLSTDADLNLLNAVRTAAASESSDMGVLVVLNDEIHCAREVTKISNFRLHAFRSPDSGILGHVDADEIVFYRRPVRLHAPTTEFDVQSVASLPRVDITYAYSGADGTMVRACVAAGAQGIVSAGFPPGFTTPVEEAALVEARGQGVHVVQASRVGSGRVIDSARLKRNGFIAADNLNPAKARILLALALTITRDPGEIARIFADY